MSNVYAGIDLGGTTIKAVLASRDATRIATRSIDTESHRGPDDVMSRMVSLVSDLLNQVPSAKLCGVGVGVPGLVDVQSGITRFLPNLPTQWRDQPVGQQLRERLGAPVRLMNDVRTATLGELRHGHGQDCPNITLAFFSIGTGIGGGVVIEGKLRLGPLGAAGELGHQTIDPNGPRCGCGNRGCLEALASGSAIVAAGVRLLRSGLAPQLHARVAGDDSRVTPREMAAVADSDPLVREALVDAARAIGVAAANVVTILHPDLIVLGGGVSEIGDLLSDTVRAEISQRVGMFPTENVRVERSLLGDEAGLVGATALAIEAANDS